MARRVKPVRFHGAVQPYTAAWRCALRSPHRLCTRIAEHTVKVHGQRCCMDLRWHYDYSTHLLCSKEHRVLHTAQAHCTHSTLQCRHAPTCQCCTARVLPLRNVPATVPRADARNGRPGYVPSDRHNMRVALSLPRPCGLDTHLEFVLLLPPAPAPYVCPAVCVHLQRVPPVKHRHSSARSI